MDIEQQDRHTSLKQIKEEWRKCARMSLGLLPSAADIKSSAKDPSLSYVKAPHNHTRKEYADRIKAGNVTLPCLHT